MAVGAVVCNSVACGNTADLPEDRGKQEETEKQEQVSQQESQTEPEGGFEIAELTGTPSDYSKEENWMRIPEITHEIDTVYLYPTCYQDESDDAKPICDIDNEDMRARAGVVYENQATVFEESTNVFAPYYRQSNIYKVVGMSHTELEEYQQNEQRTDVYGLLF